MRHSHNTGSHHGHARHFGGHGHGHGFGRFGKGGEGRGGRRRVFDAAELRLVLLKLLQDQSRHGYDLIRAIEDLTAGAYSPSPGVVYPTLTMLNDMGHTREEAGDAGRRTFAITPDGEAFLAARSQEVAELFARLAALGARQEQVDGAPIRRAMGNLKAVLMHKLGEDKVAPDTIHAVTAIIDDAAQKIERL